MLILIYSENVGSLNKYLKFEDYMPYVVKIWAGQREILEFEEFVSQFGLVQGLCQV